MKASRMASATRATKMAWATNAAGCSRRSLLKTEPIVQSEIRVGSALAALLIGNVRADILPWRYGKPQCAAESLRTKASDLIDAGEIFRSCSQKDIPGKVPLFSPCDRESQARNFRWAPLRAQALKVASGFYFVQRESPVVRQISEDDTAESQNFSSAIPIPMLLISEFEPAYDASLPDLPPVIQFEECFGFREYSAVVRGRAS